MSKLSFNHGLHARMLKESSLLAKQYRIDCGLEPKTAQQEDVVDTGVNTPKVETNVTEAKEIEENIEEGEKVEFTKEDLQSRLKKANIKYNWNSKDETLLKKCIENNLFD